MTLTQDQATERLSSERNLANRFKVTELRRPGGLVHQTFMCSEAQTSVALLARAGNDKQKDIGDIFGVTQARVSQIKRGESTSANEELIAQKLGQVRDTALDKLTDALLGITSDKLAATDAKGLSSIASNMSKVVESTLPKNAGNSTNVEVHVYAPEIRPERLYKSVEV